MITVTGGVYEEKCIEPFWDEIYGSAGRAAAALSGHIPVRLVTYRAEPFSDGLDNLERGYGISIEGPTAGDGVSFSYMHSLSVPHIKPRPDGISRNDALKVSDDIVLRFGMLDGDAIVKARKAIYDPQSAFAPTNFRENGSEAEELALILNRFEARKLSGKADLEQALDSLIDTQGATVVVIKMGSQGALVAHGSERHRVPAYRSDNVFKIGSGDVFSAAFALFWGARNLAPEAAAELASRAVSFYVNSRTLPIPTQEELSSSSLEAVSPRQGQGQVYLASPFFDIGQRWLVEEIRTLLLDVGATVFSPLHDIGDGPGSVVAPEDLRGLDESDAVIAVLSGADVGTVFEVGYAVAAKKPLIALAQNMRAEDLKMVEGTNCLIVRDLVSAIYQVIWAL
jgi:hypothetical protein